MRVRALVSFSTSRQKYKIGEEFEISDDISLLWEGRGLIAKLELWNENGNGKGKENNQEDIQNDYPIKKKRGRKPKMRFSDLTKEAKNFSIKK